MKRLLENLRIAMNPSREELSALNRALAVQRLDKNEFFLETGGPADKVAFLEKGSMRQFFCAGGKESTGDFFFENAFIGSLGSFLSRKPSRINISAIEPCELLVLDYEKAMELIAQYPTIRKFVMIILQEEFLRAETREYALLELSPEERFHKLLEEHPKIFKRIPLHYIAGYLGITPETLSRYRNKKNGQ